MVMLGHREPAEHARPPGPARRPAAGPADGVGRRPGGPGRRAPSTELLADWADRCHADGGLVVGAHFPLPLAEIAADIVAGRIDAIEMQTFAPGLDNPTILEWYRFLNCGYRLPVLGGTDKMSAEMAARRGPDVRPARARPPPSFEAWAAAVRAGRTLGVLGAGPRARRRRPRTGRRRAPARRPADGSRFGSGPARRSRSSASWSWS